jgi:UDP-perosamine 4-acetyltransferase
MQETIILGSGGHAKVIIEVMREAGVYHPVGCVASFASGAPSILGVPVLGDDQDLPELRRLGIPCAFVALGDNRLRAQLLRRVVKLGFELASAVSPSSTISPSARLGAGIAVMPGANVGTDSVVADGVIVNSHASIDHDCVLQLCCHVAPGATLAGNVTIESEAFVGAGSCLIPGVTVGAGSLVGAGSVVIRDIPPQMLAFGNPARCHRSLNLEVVHPTDATPKPDGP